MDTVSNYAACLHGDAECSVSGSGGGGEFSLIHSPIGSIATLTDLSRIDLFSIPGEAR